MPKTEFMLFTYKHTQTQNHRELIFVFPFFMTRVQHLTQDPVPDIQQDTCFVFWDVWCFIPLLLLPLFKLGQLSGQQTSAFLIPANSHNNCHVGQVWRLITRMDKLCSILQYGWNRLYRHRCMRNLIYIVACVNLVNFSCKPLSKFTTRVHSHLQIFYNSTYNERKMILGQKFP
jgi:hypothetical protein